MSGALVAVVAGLARGVWVENVHNGVLALALTAVGAYVLHQQPGHRSGRVFLAAGVVEAVMFLGRQLGHHPSPGTSAWWGWIGVWPVVVGLALVTLSVVLFPDGRLPTPGWRWVVVVAGVVTVLLATLSALWPVEVTSTGVVTPFPFHLPGGELAGDVWSALARPTFATLQLLWIVAAVARWRASGPAVRRQLTFVGAAAIVSGIALVVGLAGWGSPTPGVLAACLVPLAAGWAIAHHRFLATHSVLTWRAGRSGDADALPGVLAAVAAQALSAGRVVVWARAGERFHAVGMWPDHGEVVEPVSDPVVLDARWPLCQLVERAGVTVAAVTMDRTQPLSRHEQQLLDALGAQASLIVGMVVGMVDAAAGSSPAPAARFGRLTPREQDVLDLMARGMTNAAICAELHLSVKTVEPVVSSIFTKLDLPPDATTNRRVLAVLAYVEQRVAADD
jgi:DNA-binding CsgD family transcriptional regulator